MNMNLCTCQGYLAWQHLVHQQSWVVFWPDLFHKMARKTAMAMRMQEGGPDFMRKIMKLFRHTRGPYKSSKFGKLISEARDGLIDLLQRNPDHEILDAWMCGLAKDHESPLHNRHALADDFDRKAALDCLMEQKGAFPN